MFAFLFLSLTLSSAVILEAAGQQTQPQGVDPITETLRVDVDLVTLGVRVSDNKGQDIGGLTLNDFSVYEDGRRQQIATFAAEQQPVSVLVLLEGGYSMLRGDRLEHAKRALRQLAEHGHPDSEYSLMVFDDEPNLLVDFVQDWQRIETALGRLIPRGNGSGLYDSIAVALDQFDKATYPRQALVFITDGADQNSRLNLEDVRRRVQVSRSQVHLVGYFEPKEDDVFRSSQSTVTLVSGREIDNPRYAFRRLAEESGAETYFPASGEELETAMRRIATDLKTQYTVAYYTAAAQRAPYRRIEVRVRPRRLVVRTRHGFSLSTDEDIDARSADPSLPPAADTISQRSFPYEINVERQGQLVIFREDFSDAASGWPQKPGFYLKSGSYHLENARSTRNDDGLVAANGPVWTDLRASVSVEFASYYRGLGSVSPAAGLVFRLNDRGYYAFLISPSGTSSIHYKLVRRDFDSAVARDLISWQEDSRTGARGASGRKLEVICVGDLIQLFINDVQVHELRDIGLEEGLVGASLFGEGHAVFDDLAARSIID